MLLFLLLVALSLFIVRVLEPAGAPSQEDLPEGLEWIMSIYGSGPSLEEQFVGPNHTAIAPDGTIWVTDTSSARVMAFAPDGTPRRVIRMPADQADMMISPAGIAVGEDGSVYVAAFGSDLVLVFASDGEMLRAFHVTLPKEVDVRDDRVAVTTPDGVVLLTTDGEEIARFGARGAGAEQTDSAQGVVIGPDGTIYVADTLNSQVKAFDSSGNLLWATEKGFSNVPGRAIEATGEPVFEVPSGMTMDGNGRLVLVDPFAFQIVVLDPAREGAVVGRYGEFGGDDGYFAYPTGISYDPDRDWFAVADTANARVQVVRIPGSGGDAMAAVRRSVPFPLWVCSAPLILLLIALIIAASGRRRRREEEHQESLA
ncbi:MAG: hypothetical protein Kow0056_06630 [Coriobacteriia bacterium]